MSVKLKYTREAIETPLEGLELQKVRLFDETGGETPWVKMLPDGRQVLQNNALCFFPFPSWGMVLPKEKDINVEVYTKAFTLPLHPEAYDYMLEEKMIDAEGFFIGKPLEVKTDE